ncbi:MAG TPA: DUF1697 domain-containing protein [Solirubrobacteraceae bacterium]|nr:DUF1697 domain-containing protein [Solirubrobacteraceae bacterium]
MLLRGVNLGARNRVAMASLREELAAAGFEHVSTYLESGNVVLSSAAPEQRLARRVKRLLAERFELDVAVIVRTRDQLAEVVARDPLGETAHDPKRYQVSFLEREPDRALVDRVAALAAGSERLLAIGRELYAWHPEGIARSKLSTALAAPSLGIPSTARNWSTVTSLLALAGEDPSA